MRSRLKQISAEQNPALLKPLYLCTFTCEGAKMLELGKAAEF